MQKDSAESQLNFDSNKQSIINNPHAKIELSEGVDQNEVISKNQSANSQKQTKHPKVKNNKNNQSKLRPQQISNSLTKLFAINIKGSQKYDPSDLDNQKQHQLPIISTEEVKLSILEIKQLGYAEAGDFRKLLRSIIFKQFNFSQKEINENTNANNNQIEHLSIEVFSNLSHLFRDFQINTTINQCLYEEFSLFWKELLGKGQNKISKQQIFQIWRLVPFLKLEGYLKRFDLLAQFQSQNINKFLKQLTNAIFEKKKLHQSFQYFRLYIHDKTFEEKEQKLIQIFEDEQIIPKMLNQDRVFAEYAMKLLENNDRVKTKLIFNQNFDKEISVKLIQNLKDDVRKYEHLYNFVLKKHYRHIFHEHSQWYIIEDKLSFNKKFISWFVEDLEQAQEGNQHCKKLKKMIAYIPSQDQQSMIDSMKLRNNLVQEIQTKYVENPLYENDSFAPSDQIIEHIISTQQNQHQMHQKCYLEFKALGFSFEDMKFIDSIDQNFNKMVDDILTSKVIGFDTEFRCTPTKYEQQGVSIIQLATRKACYIIDFLKLEHAKQLQEFIVRLMEDENMLKIGHTFSSDLKYLSYTFKAEMKSKGLIDLCHLLKENFPVEKYSSLAFMCEKFLGKQLSKYNQRSNWNRRPLHKMQIHYAALDAFACLILYQKLKTPPIHHLPKDQPKEESIQYEIHQYFKKQKFAIKKTQQMKETVQQQSELIEGLVCDYEKYGSLLKNPIFLVDNMLKKLSTTMRNYGIDTEYISVKDYEIILSMAKKEGRVILTRDKKLFDKKDTKVPIYMITQKNDSQKMFEEVLKSFKINLEEFSPLSRCVKCNCNDLLVITPEEANIQIQFKYTENPIQHFWRCAKCRQIYWEGGQFEKAKNKFAGAKSKIVEKI